MGVRNWRSRYWTSGGTSGREVESSDMGNGRIAIPTAFLVSAPDVKHPDHVTNSGGCRFYFRAVGSPGILQSSRTGLRQSPTSGTPISRSASVTDVL